MPVMTTYRAQNIMRELLDRLKKTVAATLPVVTESQNATDASPVVTLSADATPTTGEKIVVIKVIPTGAPAAYDVFNNAGNKYGPHIIQICTEKNFEGTTDNVLDILGPTELLPIIAEAATMGCTIEWYRTNNGTAPTEAGITGTPAAKWSPLLYNPLSGS